MPKLRRQRKRQKYRFDVNRSRVRKSAEKYSKFNVKVECDILKAAWDNRNQFKFLIISLYPPLSLSLFSPIVVFVCLYDSLCIFLFMTPFNWCVDYMGVTAPVREIFQMWTFPPPGPPRVK